MANDPTNPEGDPFYPPAVPTLVFCLHCQQEYDSYRIEWRIEPDVNGKPRGWWCCPISGCDGKGFLFDIYPVDPTFQDERGEWFCDDEEESEDDDADSDGAPDDEDSKDNSGDSQGEEIPF